jgi:protein SCO1/2
VQAALEGDPALRDVQLLSVTLDPTFDTPAVLAAYADAMHADPKRWQFLTGTPAQVEQLTRAFAIHVERGGLLIDHTLATAVIDRDGRVAEVWRGNGWKVGEVVDVISRETSAAGERAGGHR